MVVNYFTFLFVQYFNEKTYIEDFQAIDKNADGAVSFQEMKTWIAKKAKTIGGGWKTLLDSPEIYKIAHVQTSLRYSMRSNDEIRTQIFDISEFRTFLIFLFILSVLSVHFKSADSWEAAQDSRNDSLSLDEYRLAARSFCDAKKQETLTNEQIKEDFDLLDTNGDGMVSFLEVLNIFHGRRE